MENIEEQMIFLDHVQSQDEILSNYTIVPINNNDNNKESSESQTIFGNSGLQPPEIADLGNLIRIPFYFENNNVYSRDTYYDQRQGLQQNNNMILQGNSDIQNFEPQLQNTKFSSQTDSSHAQYDQNEWPVSLPSPAPHVNEMFHHNFSQMVLESPFPSPNFLTMTTTTTLPLISIGDSPNFNYMQRSSQNFPHLYENECQSRANLHPPNTLCTQKPPVYTKWTEEEDELLRAAISIYGPHKWSLIAAHVPNRTPMQCSTRWLGALNPTIHKGRWTPEEDIALKEAVSEYVDLLDSDGHPQPIPWNKIASRIPHRTGIQCQARWSEALDPNVRKGKWSPEEDEVLKEGVRRYGRCWIRIAELIEGRTQRQCRTRWVQIRNKQAKIERDTVAAKSATETTVSTDDESNEILKPPRTTPSTPAQTVINHAQGQEFQGLLRSMNNMNAVSSAIPHVTTKNQSPIISPTGTSATQGYNVTTLENLSSSPSFNKSSHHLYLNPFLH